MLYFAYGSNLCKSDMRERCPASVAVGAATLTGHRRVFRGWADVEPTAGASVSGGLWRITPACLAALDAYEEVEAGLYRRLVLPVASAASGPVEAVVYRMNASHLAPPEPDYLAAVLRGCRDFGLDDGAVLSAAGDVGIERRPSALA